MITNIKINNRPKTVNHLEPFLSMNSVNKSPNLKDKYAIIKNLILREIKLTNIKINRLNPIKPLAIVNTLYGKGVNPAKKRILNQARKPFP